MQFITSCVGLSYQDSQALQHTVNQAISISYRTFRKRVGGAAVDALAQHLGYDLTGRDLHIKQDWAVRFYRSTWNSKPCYFLVWSGIEFIFQ